jgi:hypothetical protein
MSSSNISIWAAWFEHGRLRDRAAGRTPQSQETERDLRQINRLIDLADKALAAQASELKALEQELNGIIAWFVKGQASGTTDSTAFSIAIAHARHAIEKQREALRQGQTGSIATTIGGQHEKKK